jgi:hypothetical protein
MTYTLIDHSQGYNLQNTQALCSLMTLTAFDYGQRHRELARTQPQNWLGHTVLFIVDCIPVIGIIVAAIEYLVARFFVNMLATTKAASLIHRLAILPDAPSLQVKKEEIAPTDPVIDVVIHKQPDPIPEPVKKEEIVPTDPVIDVVIQKKPDPIPEPVTEEVITTTPIEVNPVTAPLDEPIPPLPISFRNTDDLLRETQDYFNNAEIPPPLTFPEINMQGLSQNDLIQTLLNKYEGLCIGEYHDHSSPKYFLTVHMPLFKRLGVTTLYLEGYIAGQKELDEYFTGDSMEIPESFKKKISCFAAPYQPGYYSEYDVLMAAKREGIRMVSIDSSAACARTGGTLRVAAMNYQAKLIIDKDKIEHPGGKSIIYAGGAHANRIAGVPSLGQMYQLPSFLIRDRLFTHCIGADAIKLPNFTAYKEIAEKSSTDKRVENIDFLIQMDKPLK